MDFSVGVDFFSFSVVFFFCSVFVVLFVTALCCSTSNKLCSPNDQQFLTIGIDSPTLFDSSVGGTVYAGSALPSS